MKKIMFNDKYGLTAAVLEGRKTMTRRIIKAPRHTIEGKKVCGFAVYKTHEGVPYEVWLTGPYDESMCHLLPTYQIGETVAVAQSYCDVYNGLFDDIAHINNDRALELHMSYILMEAQKDTLPGWTNKMYVRANLMLHHIRITDIKLERLQDISDEDCLKEGIYYDQTLKQFDTHYTFKNWYIGKTRIAMEYPRYAFAALIDKVSGKGTWDSNPWVFVYSFKLID